MVALAAVGTLLIATLNSYTTILKTAFETEQLLNILNHVAAKANELITVAAASNCSTQVFLQLPSSIGYQQYWLRARNDSSSTWIEGSLGKIVEETAPNRLFLPRSTSASGYFIGGYGLAVLESYMNGSIPQITLAYRGG